MTDLPEILTDFRIGNLQGNHFALVARTSCKKLSPLTQIVRGDFRSERPCSTAKET